MQEEMIEKDEDVEHFVFVCLFRNPCSFLLNEWVKAAGRRVTEGLPKFPKQQF
jgi:hypothetical protein